MKTHDQVKWQANVHSLQGDHSDSELPVWRKLSLFSNAQV